MAAVSRYRRSMTTPNPYELFLVSAPGLEPVLAAEAAALGLGPVRPVPGGVLVTGGWETVWRANLGLRTAVRVLVRVAEFRALHLAQLDKRARKVDWAGLLRADVPVRVEAVCRKSRIYHQGAAAERVAAAITAACGAAAMAVGGREKAGDVEEAETAAEAARQITLKVRIEDDLCTLSLDSTGAPLHRRGHKEAVGKAPLRETLAAAFLRLCAYDGAEPVVDPMCGSGTIPIEAAEIAAGCAPGRSRRFAFEDLASADAARWDAMRAAAAISAAPPGAPPILGFDRDAGAIRAATANAVRAGVGDRIRFACQPISALEPPPGAPGLVLVNPPYGERIGNRKLLFGLYGSFGQVMRERFGGWRVGLVTSDAGLAKATGLPLEPAAPPVGFGGLKVTLWRTGTL